MDVTNNEAAAVDTYESSKVEWHRFGPLQYLYIVRGVGGYQMSRVGI